MCVYVCPCKCVRVCANAVDYVDPFFHKDNAVIACIQFAFPVRSHVLSPITLSGSPEQDLQRMSICHYTVLPVLQVVVTT